MVQGSAAAASAAAAAKTQGIPVPPVPPLIAAGTPVVPLAPPAAGFVAGPAVVPGEFLSRRLADAPAAFRLRTLPLSACTSHPVARHFRCYKEWKLE